MGQIKGAPAPLKRKLFLTGIIGAGCLLIGVSMCFILKDRSMLFLSLAVFVASAGRALSYYRIITDKATRPSRASAFRSSLSRCANTVRSKLWTATVTSLLCCSVSNQR